MSTSPCTLSPKCDRPPRSHPISTGAADVNNENRVRPGISFNYSCRIGLHAKDKLAQIHVEILTNHPPIFKLITFGKSNPFAQEVRMPGQEFQEIFSRRFVDCSTL